MKACPELTYDVDTKVMAFALKFLNSAPKEKLVAELEIAEHIAHKIIDQRDFGGYQNLDDVYEKKLLRKKKFTAFRDRLLEYAKDNKPSEKVDDDDGVKVSKKGKKKSGANGGNASVSLDGEVHKVEKPVFKESEPLRFRCGYLVAPPPKPVVEAAPIVDVIDEPILTA
ncbi:hypothetical protein LEN26_017791 [Aphanomyces euteiches]|nr:hypothetical protein LEN26_017791 [Aphanomyces euteiches]KAH9124145.1 hypothetical protein AeMF1_005040 [Aphanomyces euteiches]KAH9187328.1 hypothetical protein AeNC1_010698 [Aphanomyces euteiches]